MRARWVLTWKSTSKAKARLCVLGFHDPDLAEVPRDGPTDTFCTGRGLDLTVRGVKQVKAVVRRHEDGIFVRRRGPP